MEDQRGSGTDGRSQKLTRQRTGNAKEQRFLLGLTGTLSLTTHDSLFLPFPFPLQPLDCDFRNIKEGEYLAFVSDLAPGSWGCGGRGENARHCLPAPGPGTLPGRHRHLAAACENRLPAECTKPPRARKLPAPAPHLPRGIHPVSSPHPHSPPPTAPRLPSREDYLLRDSAGDARRRRSPCGHVPLWVPGFAFHARHPSAGQAAPSPSGLRRVAGEPWMKPLHVLMLVLPHAFLCSTQN